MLHYVVLAYGAASLLYMLFFMSSNNRCLKLIFKIIPLLILGFGNTHIILSVAAPFDIKGSDFLPRLSKFNWSLIFCLMGDAYLVFPSLFLYGLFSFAIGQGFLAMMFSDNLHTLSQLTRNELASGVCVLIMSVAIYMYMYPKFKRVMVIPTMIYGIMQAQKFLSYSTACGAGGAALFYCQMCCCPSKSGGRRCQSTRNDHILRRYAAYCLSSPVWLDKLTHCVIKWLLKIVYHSSSVLPGHSAHTFASLRQSIHPMSLYCCTSSKSTSTASYQCQYQCRVLSDSFDAYHV